ARKQLGQERHGFLDSWLLDLFLFLVRTRPLIVLMPRRTAAFTALDCVPAELLQFLADGIFLDAECFRNLPGLDGRVVLHQGRQSTDLTLALFTLVDGSEVASLVDNGHGRERPVVGLPGSG